MFKNLQLCCGEYPTVCMPMLWGNKQIDEPLKPSIQCRVCKREVEGISDEELEYKWNSIDV